MKSLQRTGVLLSLLVGGAMGALTAPLSAHALTVTIDGRTVQLAPTTTSPPCNPGYNLCAYIPPGIYNNWTVGDASSSNKARIMIADNSTIGSLDLLKLTGITFTPVDQRTTTTKTTRVVVTHTYNAGGGNPVGDYSWGYGMAGYLDPLNTESIVGDQLQQTSQGNFGSRLGTKTLGLGLDTGRLTTPSTNGLNGSVTKSRAAIVVMPQCDTTGNAKCAPTITQTFTLTVVGADKLVLSDSLIGAGGICDLSLELPPVPSNLHALMRRLDPQAPTDATLLSEWQVRMDEKHAENPSQKKLLTYVIRELGKWLEATRPGSCPHLHHRVNQVIREDVQEELVDQQATGELFAVAKSGPSTGTSTSTITITKQTNQVTPNPSFGFTIPGLSPVNHTISMGDSTSQTLIIPVDPGNYVVDEATPLPGWTLTNVDCSPQPPRTITVLPNSNVECTFINTFAGPGSVTFTPLGFLAGSGLTSAARDVSADGSVVVGYAVGVASQEAFYWRADTGMIPLNSGVFGIGEAVSNDGDVVVGQASLASPPLTATRAFRWKDASMLNLGTLPSFPPEPAFSFAQNVSADGTVVVGSSYQADSGIDPGFYPFRWTAASGMVGLGTSLDGENITNSNTRGVSADGSVIVGWASTDASSNIDMFRWTAADGMQKVEVLADVPGAVAVRPASVSDNGTITVGDISHIPPGGIVEITDAFCWSPSGFVLLPGLPGVTNTARSNAAAITFVGTSIVIVGLALDEANTEQAVIWRRLGAAGTCGVTSDWTIRKLKDVLLHDFGVSAVTHWELYGATGMSPDGRFIVGHGKNPVGQGEGWRIQLP